jgi:hypothetical protein
MVYIQPHIHSSSLMTVAQQYILRLSGSIIESWLNVVKKTSFKVFAHNNQHIPWQIEFCKQIEFWKHIMMLSPYKTRNHLQHISLI